MDLALGLEGAGPAKEDDTGTSNPFLVSFDELYRPSLLNTAPEYELANAAWAEFGNSIKFEELKQPDIPQGSIRQDIPDLELPQESESSSDESFLDAQESTERLTKDVSLPEPKAEVEVNGDDVLLDIDWLLNEPPSLFSSSKPKMWESFLKTENYHCSIYLSDCSPLTLEALINPDPHSPIPTTTPTSPHLLRALLAFGLGHAPASTYPPAATPATTPQLLALRPPGLHPATFAALLAPLARGGQLFRSVRYFARRATYAPPPTLRQPRPTRARVALAHTVDALLAAAADALVGRFFLDDNDAAGGDGVGSLLQLQAAYEPVLALLEHVAGLVEGIKVGKGRSRETDVDVIEAVWRYVNYTDDAADAQVRDANQKMLSAASGPWLDALAGAVGIGSATELAENEFGEVLDGAVDEYVEDGAKSVKPGELMPSFVQDQDREAILQIRSTLSLLKEHCAEDDLSLTVGTSEQKFEWAFTWADVERIEKRAQDYEATLKQAISDQGKLTCKIPPAPKPAESVTYPFAIPEGLLFTDQPTLTPVDEADEAAEYGLDIVSPAYSQPLPFPSQLTLAPLLRAKARALDRASLRTLFHGRSGSSSSHRLRAHAALLRRFALLRDGCFAARLSSVLFDPPPQTDAAEPGDGRRQAPSSAGATLRLGHRTTWPPASAELQLALGEVLLPSVDSGSGAREASAEMNGEEEEELIKNYLSFAIRPLSGAQLDACLDPHALEALDFLRLDYRPPPPLDAVFSARARDGVERAFGWLLRGARLLKVTGWLCSLREGREKVGGRGKGKVGKDIDAVAAVERAHWRLRFEVRSFVAELATHLDACVEAGWRRFEQALAEAEARLEKGAWADGSGGGGEVIVPPHISLRRVLERSVDGMLFALLLRRRHAPVMKVLEDALRIVLRYAKEVEQQGSKGGDDGSDVSGEVRRLTALRTEFRQKVGLFVRVCKGVAAARTERKTKGEEDYVEGADENQEEEEARAALQRLAWRLEINGW